MTDEEKVEMCTKAAGAVINRYYNPKTEKDELIAVGYLGISSDEPKLAFCQAYTHMLNFITKQIEIRPSAPCLRCADIYTRDDLLDLDNAVYCLTDDERDLIQMKFVQGYNNPAIAELTKVARQSVERKLHNLLNKMRRMLK